MQCSPPEVSWNNCHQKANQIFGTYQPIFGTNQPIFGTHQPIFRTCKPIFWTQQPIFGTYQPIFGTYQPIFGTCSDQSSGHLTKYLTHRCKSYRSILRKKKNTQLRERRPLSLVLLRFLLVLSYVHCVRDVLSIK